MPLIFLSLRQTRELMPQPRSTQSASSDLRQARLSLCDRARKWQTGTCRPQAGSCYLRCRALVRAALRAAAERPAEPFVRIALRGSDAGVSRVTITPRHIDSVFGLCTILSKKREAV
jgi:hypothetical protein